jgi:hypothetical protein
LVALPFFYFARRVPSKSELQRFAHWLNAAQMRQMMERLLRAGMDSSGPLEADRGFASKANSGGLAEAEIFDGLCPKSPAALKERMKEPRFVRMQKRRSHHTSCGAWNCKRAAFGTESILSRQVNRKQIPGR